MRFAIPLSFHNQRVQPLSDLLENHDADVFLTAKEPIEVNVSVMTTRGIAHCDKVVLGATPYKVPYDPPWGRDWRVLQILANKAREADEEPFEVTLTMEVR